MGSYLGSSGTFVRVSIRDNMQQLIFLAQMFSHCYRKITLSENLPRHGLKVEALNCSVRRLGSSLSNFDALTLQQDWIILTKR